MFDFSKYKDKLKNDIGEKRFNHVIRVKDMALKINKNIDIEKIKTAALLHDCAKYNEKYYLDKYKKYCDFSNEIISNKAILHSFLGPIVAKYEYGVDDDEILNAIKYHTTGKENMTDFEKIIYLADKTEDKRDYDGVQEIRRLSKINLNKAIVKSLDDTIKYLIEGEREISITSVNVRNYLLKGV